MLYVQVNDMNEVVMTASNPLDPTYGLGKTEEELHETGFLFEFLEELPTPAKRDGHRAVTYCDGEKFWFGYKPLDKVDLEKLLLRVETLRAQDAAKNREIKGLKEELAATKLVQEDNGLSTMALSEELELVSRKTDEGIAGMEFQIEERTKRIEQVANELPLLDRKIVETAETISAELAETASRLDEENRLNGDAIAAQHENISGKFETVRKDKESMEQEIESVRIETEEKVTLTNNRLSSTEETVAASFMEIFSTQMGLHQANGAANEAREMAVQSQQVIGEQASQLMGAEMMVAETFLQMIHMQMDATMLGNEMRLAVEELQEVRKNILAANEELVKTNEEVSRTQEQLRDAQAELAALFLMMLEGGMTT